MPVVKASDVDYLASLHAEHLPAFCRAAIALSLGRASHLEAHQKRSRTRNHLGDPSSSTPLPTPAPPFDHLFATAAVRVLALGCSPTYVWRQQLAKPSEIC
ncbi:MAG: hypothetical protein WA695_08130 [Candidatus Dormiibacterota bacterium]